MDYHYEVLDHQRFQKLSQALIVAQYPNAQCLPVGQPDGGRDAQFIPTGATQTEFIVFQVKFSQDPESKTDRAAINTLIKSEKHNVEKLIQQGATHYYFITNVRGTAYPASGSIDQVNKELSDAFGISVYVWWRDDLDRRIDNANEIKWSYPEILKATDILPLLIQRHEDLSAAPVLKNYMATQYQTERDVKFKQVELQRRLTELFVDLPLGHKRSRADQNQRQRFYPDLPGDIEGYVGQLDFDEDYNFAAGNPFEHGGLAGAFLLRMPPWAGVSRFVVEGAPGQGKSTVTQFLCQVNRLRLLKKEPELKAVQDVHKTAVVRVPFRVDLRDYAAFVGGRNPFMTGNEATAGTLVSRSLESFLARQVTSLSGGLNITTGELQRFLAGSHSVLVLDGFDEVADIATREHLVDEIREAATRLGSFAKSIQIIVTSRPAAFANSPGFPEDEWIHLELKDLGRPNIVAYKDKWIRAQGLNKEEGELVSSTLEEKLQQPHLRDLARNPMQLAILLHLIHVQGVALPEKRTTLYEEYMKLFFNRESEKSPFVRDHRELLLLIHGVLAWVLHTQAEDGSGSGSITRTALRTAIKHYLDVEGHDPQIVDELLKGTVERVGALVSRVEGTFEFEVQPLREYFAARHLYKTAPYSPVGQVRKGTLPDRFQAIARSFYWTNVTRFFCGFYDVGQLASLVEGITELSEQDNYKLINQPRRLAMMLLADQVFSQAPKTLKRLIDFVSVEPGFQRLTAALTLQRQHNLALPAKVGGSALFEVCGRKLEAEEDPVRRGALRAVMAENASRETLKGVWERRFADNSMRCDPILEAADFGIVNQFTAQEIAAAAKDDLLFQVRWLILANQYEAIAGNPTLRERARKAFFDGDVEFFPRWRQPRDSVTALEPISELLRAPVLASLYSGTEDGMSALAALDHEFAFDGREIVEQVRGQFRKDSDDPLERFALFVVDLLGREVREWRHSLGPWAALVDQGWHVAPGSFVLLRTAIIATAARAEEAEGVWDKDGFLVTRGLVQRLYFARHQCDDTGWWRTRLKELNGETASQCLATLLSWGSPAVIASLTAEIEAAIQKLSSREWMRLWSLAGLVARAVQGSGVGLTGFWFENVGELSPRVAVILLARLNDRNAARHMSRHYFADYDGDDEYILRRAMQMELVRSKDDVVDWEYVRRLSIRVQQAGVHTPLPVSSAMQAKVPKEVAEVVLSNCKDYSAPFVAICEQAYATVVAQAAPKVSYVAESEGWFEPTD